MIKVKRIDHVAIAVPPGAANALTGTLGGLFALAGTHPEVIGNQGVEARFLTPATPDGSSAAIEIITPAGAAPNGSVQRFVDKRGTALHHICLEVDDLSDALATLKTAGVPLVDDQPRRGARGHWVAFIHPGATGGVLFELCQPETTNGELD